MKNLKFQSIYERVLKVALLSMVTFLLLAPVAFAQTSGTKPKFFICSEGMQRFATIVTTKHDINLCGESGNVASVLAFRSTGQSEITSLPLASNKHPVYSAVASNGTTYKLDTNQKLLTITPKKGKASKEKVVRSD
ncbi:MAG: hypothetical protein KME60_18460 [Cyanomargarita calcarea GSE-NOS-MK-12-04C]|jgi:hypothetical protein|uniref:Uncharacterized protein n=1 Tax=Cyanomargarita calcarea GSE-NOS-MK-12-04C TaxID=2839659 RepID=A0A951QRD6_9CYAN|nr:hypothetical protein [Cyanomargarita calcarea GSE-NOS-MK-12-04C]